MTRPLERDRSNAWSCSFTVSACEESCREEKQVSPNDVRVDRATRVSKEATRARSGRWWIMARKDALLRLHRRLQERRRDLLGYLADEIGDLEHDRSNMDDADAAFDTISTEMTSQLAQLEYREVQQIDRALAHLRNGTYGTCELCSCKIPVARLNALPYSTLCIGCQRRLEVDPGLAEDFKRGWQRVSDNEATQTDVNYNVSDIEYKLS